MSADKNVQTENGSPIQSSVTVKGGQTIGDWETDNKDAAVLMLTVTGGTHEEDVNDYIPTGAALTQNESGEIIPNPTVNVVASIDGIGYNSLANAIAAANDGETVVVLQDAKTEALTVDKSITIRGETGVETVTFTGVPSSPVDGDYQSFLIISDGVVAIKDLKFEVADEVVVKSAVIDVPSSAENAKLIMDNVTITNFPHAAVKVWNGSAEVTGCTITCTRTGDDNVADFQKGVTIDGNGKADESRVKVDITDTEVSGVISLDETYTSAGIEIWGGCEVTIDGCTVESMAAGIAVQRWSGNSDVTIRNTKVDAGPDGAASVMDYPGTTGTLNVSIESGTYMGTLGCMWGWNGSNYTASGSTNDEFNLNISGGSYDRSVAEYVVPELNYEAHADELYTYHETLEEALATGGTVRSIAAARATDESKATVTLIDGSVRSTVVYVSGEEITLPVLNRNGYTFGGWRVNGGAVVPGGTTYKVTGNTTFTAIWNAINIPDTYDIELIVGEGGEASTSLGNASAGSTITVTVTPDEGFELAYITVDGERISGTTFTMPDHDVTVRVYFTDGSVEMPFVDVNTGDWFYDEVAYVYANGLMDGVSTTRFNPNGTMTRSMVWAILARVDGETVTGANWIETARSWAMANGVSDGENANGYVTREQLATMLWRYAGEPASSYSLSAFTDAASVSDYAETAMVWAVEHGIITGMTDTTIESQGTAIRAQCAAMLMRFMEL